MVTHATGTASGAPLAPTGARDKLLDAAYELFSRDGVKGVGIDAVIARAGVARQSLYRTFGSKEALVLAFLERRDRQWTTGWLRHEVEERSDVPAERLLAIFDVFGEWFHTADFEGCSFINVMLEHTDRDDPVRDATTGYLVTIRAFLAETAERAGIEDPDDFARQWHILMKGSIVAAGEGDVEAAERAQRMGRLLLHDHGL